MKNFLFFFIFLGSLVFSQEAEVYPNGVFEFRENAPHKIFTDETRVRQAPDLDAIILDSLSANQSIYILEKAEIVLKLGERSAHWYRISYDKEGRKKEGFVWGGNLCIGYRHQDGKDFLFGMLKTETKYNTEYNENYSQNIASVKVMKGFEALEEQTLETGTGETLSFASFEILAHNELQNVDSIVKATVSGEACGIPTYDQYLLYSHGKLIALPQLVSVSDAGNYYHSEHYVFPNDKNGEKDKILLITEETEIDEKGNETQNNNQKKYSWNGEKLQLLHSSL